MPSVIFSGNNVKTLKQNIDFNGQVSILSGTVDPTSSATSAPAGSIYLNTSSGLLYRKTDAGSSTNWKIISSASAGDILETSFTAADNQGSVANVTGLAFANATVRAFDAIVSVFRGATYSVSTLRGIQKGASWEMSETLTGDSTGLTFSITSAGQVQYISTSTGSTAAIKFTARTVSV